jgi:hypothetical protein
MTNFHHRELLTARHPDDGLSPSVAAEEPKNPTMDTGSSALIHTSFGVSNAYLRRAGIPERPAHSSSCHPACSAPLGGFTNTAFIWKTLVDEGRLERRRTNSDHARVPWVRNQSSRASGAFWPVLEGFMPPSSCWVSTRCVQCDPIAGRPDCPSAGGVCCLRLNRAHTHRAI